MTNINDCHRGSEWRKWDLHAHTPLDHEWVNRPQFSTDENKQKFAEEYITFAESQGLSVIGITDHNFCNHSNDLLIEQIQTEAEKKSITILPGFEITASDGSGIHMLVLFPEKTPIAIIKSVIDSCFPVGTTLIPDNGIIPVSNKSIKEIHKIIQDSNTEAIFIFAHVDRDNGVLDPSTIKGTRRVQEWQNEMVGIAQISKAPSEYTSGFMNNVINKNDNNYTRDIAYIVASDCRSSNKDIAQGGRHHLGEKFTWIKANPTFEGLKQIIYEPEERIRIQESEPEEKTGYQVIDRVEINHNDIFNQELKLNSNLNSIIGGRSTGKSILLAAIAKKLKIENPPEFHNKEYENYINEISINLKVFWKDGKEDNGREVEYFKQGYMYDLARNESKLSSLIQNILRKKGKDVILDNYFSIINENKKKISSSVDNFFQILEEIKLKEDSISDKGDKKGVEDEILKLAGELKKINTEKITEEETKEYEKNKLIIEKGNETIIILQRDALNIEKLKDINLIQDNLEYELTSVSDANKNIITEKFKNLKDVFQKGWLKEIEDLKQKIATKEKENEKKIKEATENTTYAKVAKIFSQSEHLKEIEGKIKKEKDKLLVITTLLDEVKKLKDQKEKLKKSIKALHENYLLEINKLIPLLYSAAEGLEIKAKKIFKEKECGEFLESGMNKTFSTNHKYLYLSSTLEEKMIEIFNDLAENKLELKAGYTNKTLANRLLSENFYKIEYDLIYENDDFHKMSDGKKSFVVLKLLLDFSDKDCPILIDQPEDDLDNRSIYSDLVSYLKKKKKLRQIIVATHNPNLVVGADAECVIVANQHGEKSKNHNDKKFEYIQGALENTFLSEGADYVLEERGIQEHVCDILEGGRIAFEQRKKKYSL